MRGLRVSFRKFVPVNTIHMMSARQLWWFFGDPVSIVWAFCGMFRLFPYGICFELVMTFRALKKWCTTSEREEGGERGGQVGSRQLNTRDVVSSLYVGNIF